MFFPLHLAYGCMISQVSALWMVDRSRGQIDGLLNALAQDLPAKALPVIVEIISNHMEVLNFRCARAAESLHSNCDSCTFVLPRQV